MKIKIKFKNKRVELDVKSCNWFRKIKGLMFCRRKNAKILLFDFRKPVRWGFHSFFVFFSFVAIWLDDKNRVLEIKKVKPFKSNLSPKKPFVKVIEIPCSRRYYDILKLLDES